MTEYRKVLIWSFVNNSLHPELTEDERKISGIMPIIDEMFPGINYGSIVGFQQVKRNYLSPALTKLFPYLKDLNSGEVRGNENLEVGFFLPSEGYEHLEDPKWRLKLDELLV